MRTLRAWLYYIAITLYCIPVALGCVLSWPITSAEKRYDFFVREWMRFSIAAAKALCGLDYRVIGKENLPDVSERVLVFCKHQSAWETMFIPVCMPQRIGYVYKRSLHWIPFFGWAVKSMQMVGIDRGNGRAAFVQFMTRGKEFLERGWWMAIFPEGTRTAPGAENPDYKTGGARFAVSAGAKILPVALDSGSFWPRNSIAKMPGTITVSIGPAIDTTNLTHAEVHAKAVEWIEAEMRRICKPGTYA